MALHQKVNTDARLTKMIDDLGITLNPNEPKASKDKKNQTEKKDSTYKDTK
ncbi:hypothetical protein NIE88_10045 [Sporolactobacillus shoreicorticis]|uniref:Uncharacterized protein n=1 Tax=Sporolactobacillus shoreicorticis TaxID=1923877 RepID=A0ABW5S9A2_9BACL|nr:hypothetical protein [Sporolactobacillus shoreicorticis]MCO7126115.1 hypothetical protein [Sporolactobacillus shoreicorticis]